MRRERLANRYGAAKVKLDKLDKQIGNLDGHVDSDEWRALYERDATLQARCADLALQLQALCPGSGAMASLGTIGAGNHFVELQCVDTVGAQSLFDAAGMNRKCLQLLVHSGSRGLGQDILRGHVDGFGHGGLAAGSNEAARYLARHDLACRYATLNRDVIAARLLTRVRARAVKVLDVHHNTVLPALVDGLDGWLHRKGANPGDQGLVMLPGSRDDYSYLIAPKRANMPLSLQSLPHGAGRKWQRSDCKARLFKHASAEQLGRNSFGGRVICADRALIYEEAPQAYKNVDSVLDCLLGADLVDVVSRATPVLTYKTRGECC